MDAIVLKDVRKSFQGAPVLKSISATFKPGLIHGIVGRNGSGKTVLFKCICGFVPFEGDIKVFGRSIGRDVEMLSDAG